MRQLLFFSLITFLLTVIVKISFGMIWHQIGWFVALGLASILAYVVLWVFDIDVS